MSQKRNEVMELPVPSSLDDAATAVVKSKESIKVGSRDRNDRNGGGPWKNGHHYLVGGLVAINFIFPLILGMYGNVKSSQLTNSYILQRGGPTTNQL